MHEAQRYNYSFYMPLIKDKPRAIRIADRIITIAQEHFGGIEDLDCLDVGCSAGTITNIWVRRFGKTTGIDVDADAVDFARKNSSAPNVEYRAGSIMDMVFEPESFDMIVVVGIYEYVPDSEKLFRIIFSLLKKGGICYLQARNRFAVIEKETGLFIINFLPYRLAKLYARIFKKDKLYYGRQLFLPGIKKIVRRFTVYDYTLKVIRQPQRYHLFNFLSDNSLFARLLAATAAVFYFALPNYMWVLKKR